MYKSGFVYLFQYSVNANPIAFFCLVYTYDSLDFLRYARYSPPQDSSAPFGHPIYFKSQASFKY